MSEIILGLDPASFKNMGVCVAERQDTPNLMIIKQRFTKIFNVNKDTKDHRFEDLYETIENLIKEHGVNAICFERTQFGKPFVMSQIYETIGVVKLLAQKYGVELSEISPKTAKKRITNNGNAKKAEMMKEVCEKFNIDRDTLSSDHEADAVAMCYAYSIIKSEE